jgi:hypothetical protein
MGKEKLEWYKNSSILTIEEGLALSKMIQYRKCVLIYRATVDGFKAQDFHAKCNDIENTVTVIKNDLNYVFGGYTQAKWSSRNCFNSDTEAFIFSLRRNGVSTDDKLMVKDHIHAIHSYSDRLIAFGYGHDICIINESNIKLGSYTNYSISFEKPKNCFDVDLKSFLAGNYNNWFTTEIEIYQIK